MRRWLDGFALVAIYRCCGQVAKYVGNEMGGWIGPERAEDMAPVFILASWVLFGVLARYYIEVLLCRRSQVKSRMPLLSYQMRTRKRTKRTTR